MKDHILSTNHVGFTVADVRRTAQMFTEVFGYDIVSIAPRPALNVERLMGLKDAELLVAHLRHPHLAGVELIEFHGPADRARVNARPCDLGYTHLTFNVSDLGAVVAHAASFGLKAIGERIVSTAGPNKGAKAIYLKDADGITIELIQPAGTGS